MEYAWCWRDVTLQIRALQKTWHWALKVGGSAPNPLTNSGVGRCSRARGLTTLAEYALLLPGLWEKACDRVWEWPCCRKQTGLFLSMSLPLSKS